MLSACPTALSPQTPPTDSSCWWWRRPDAWSAPACCGNFWESLPLCRSGFRKPESPSRGLSPPTWNIPIGWTSAWRSMVVPMTFSENLRVDVMHGFIALLCKCCTDLTGDSSLKSVSVRRYSVAVYQCLWGGNIWLPFFHGGLGMTGRVRALPWWPRFGGPWRQPGSSCARRPNKRLCRLCREHSRAQWKGMQSAQFRSNAFMTSQANINHHYQAI